MKRWISYLFSMVVVLFLLMALNFLLLVVIQVKTQSGRYFIPIERISEDITKNGEKYEAGSEVIEKLDYANAFSFIIDSSGKVAWEYNKPKVIKDNYTMADVARFSRWYLQGYPVYTWTRGEEILVIGVPKDSMWKYVMEFSFDTVVEYQKAFPYVLVINALVVVFLPFFIANKWNDIREYKRSEWIAGISHDIRTPLSIVMGNSEKGGIIEQQCLRIKDLVNNLNTGNKLETGNGKWDEEDIKISALLRDIICDYVNCYNDKKFSFNLEIESDVEEAVIRADRTLIRRMADNIISNAVKHNENGADIFICLNRIGKNLELVISDNGKGVSEYILNKLNKGLNREAFPEHGLGLRVVRQIAKKYHYKIKFHQAPVKGLECRIIMKLRE